jgi:putative transcriptional regulator
MYHYLVCGVDDVWLANGYRWHRTAYGPALGIHDILALQAAIARSIAERPVPLTAQSFRLLRHELDLSQQALADALGCEVQALARWEKGRSRIPAPAERLLRALYLEHAGVLPVLRDMLRRLADGRDARSKKLVFERARGAWRKRKTDERGRKTGAGRRGTTRSAA